MPQDKQVISCLLPQEGQCISSVLWDVYSFPEWGIWTFTPDSGTLEDGIWQTVTAEVVVPDQENQEFDGEVKIINTDNPDDFDIVNVILTTPKSKVVSNTFFLQLLEKLIEQFSILKQLIFNFL